MESRHALRRVSLKSCQLCSVPMPLRTCSQGIPLSSFLSSWKFALLKHRVLALLFARPAFFKITNSTKAWSLQPRLPPILTSLMLSSALVSTRSSNLRLVHLLPGPGSCTQQTPGISWIVCHPPCHYCSTTVLQRCNFYCNKAKQNSNMFTELSSLKEKISKSK